MAKPARNIITVFTTTHGAGSVVSFGGHEDLYKIESSAPSGRDISIEVREDYFHKGAWGVNWSALGTTSAEDAQMFAECLLFAANFAADLTAKGS